MEKEITKSFKFKKGQQDWKTWCRVSDYICKYFSSKRKTSFARTKLKTDYEIEVKIMKLIKK